MDRPVNHSSKPLPLLHDHLLPLLHKLSLNVRNLPKPRLHLCNIIGQLSGSNVRRFAWRTFVGCCCLFQTRSFPFEMFPHEAGKSLLFLHFVDHLALGQDLLGHVLVRILVEVLNPRDLAIHIWVIVTGDQRHPAGRKN